MVKRCREKMVAHYRRHWRDATKPYDGVEELLRGLSRRTIPAAILSNKPHDFTCEMVEAFLGEYRFIDVRGACDGVPLKPDPSAALDIAHEAGIPPEQWLYLGDTGTDMETACAAGMMPIGASWGFRRRDELWNTGAQGVVDRPEEVLDYI